MRSPNSSRSGAQIHLRSPVSRGANAHNGRGREVCGRARVGALPRQRRRRQLARGEDSKTAGKSCLLLDAAAPLEAPRGHKPAEARPPGDRHITDHATTNTGERDQVEVQCATKDDTPTAKCLPLTTGS